MAKRILSMAFIYLCACLAWVALGGTTAYRTSVQDSKLKNQVGRLWGTIQRQEAPRAYCQTAVAKDVEMNEDSKTVVRKIVENIRRDVTIDSNRIRVDLKLEYRKKGLLWYSAYRVLFSGDYLLKNNTAEPNDYFFEYNFPSADGLYDDFVITVDGERVGEITPESGKVTLNYHLNPGETRNIKISYGSQGMDEWWYVFGSGVSQVRNLDLTIATDFDKIDFPENGIAPTEKSKNDKGWNLSWKYSNLISGIQIGMVMPRKLNPGPFTSRISFFAPVSLFLFFFLMFIITTIKDIRIHPMNYFFIAAAFFSFHLLMAYLVDHLDIYLSFAVCSAVSIFLVVSYMRLVTGLKFALIEIGIAQFVYLVLFSYAFFLEGFTGLSIAIACIITLFVVMQFTGKVDWDKQFERKEKNNIGPGA